jgi:fumarylacetoacetate (FAA) hydrolase
MKLGSLKGGRDGRLVVVSDDLAWCAEAGHIAPTLQAALDNWAQWRLRWNCLRPTWRTRQSR